MKQRREGILLLLLTVFLFACGLGIAQNGRLVPAENRAVKLAAAARMQACMDAVKGYKSERGIPLHPGDLHQTGMLGEEFNGMTTSLGALEAKRTSANSDMAALAVELLQQAGMQPGDRVGLGLSGSFPALNLAMLSACAELGLDTVCIASIGSSTHGANNPGLTFPEMLSLLISDGLLPDSLHSATIGGDYDCGREMDGQLREAAVERLERRGVNLWREPDYQKNLQKRLEIYGEIACYVNVGGNLMSLGRQEDSIRTQGLIPPEAPLHPVDGNSGMLELYHAQGLPVIHLLNLKRLTADYGLAFDPVSLPEPGTSAVYYRISYPRLPALLAVFSAGAVLIFEWKRRRHDGTSARG